MRVADTKGGLESNLCLSNSSQAIDGGALAVILVCSGRDPLQEIVEDRPTVNELFIASEWYNEMLSFLDTLK